MYMAVTKIITLGKMFSHFFFLIFLIIIQILFWK